MSAWDKYDFSIEQLEAAKRMKEDLKVKDEQIQTKLTGLAQKVGRLLVEEEVTGKGSNEAKEAITAYREFYDKAVLRKKEIDRQINVLEKIINRLS